MGVCHNVSKKELGEEYEKHKSVIPISKNYKLIVLGGDVQNPDGNWTEYNTQDADNLINTLEKVEISKEDCILILNDPRTGQRLKDKLQEKAHTSENTIANEGSDHITKYFISRLKAAGYSNVNLFDFLKGHPSLYKAVLGVLNTATNNTVLISGEATNMISEIIDNLGDANNAIYLYEHGAMNEAHYRHIKNEYNNGRANIITEQGEILKAQNKTTSTLESAASLVAKKILQMLEKKIN